MHTRHFNYFLPREDVYKLLTKEDQYAQRWGVGKKADNPEFPNHVVDRVTGEPFGEADFVAFAEEYLRQFWAAHAAYCPDRRALRIRIMKAASLLVSALQVYGSVDDINDIAGISSDKFPVYAPGLKTFEDAGSKQGKDGAV